MNCDSTLQNPSKNINLGKVANIISGPCSQQRVYYKHHAICRRSSNPQEHFMNCILQLISYSKEEVIKNSGYDICDVCLWLHTKISLYKCNISILVKEWDIVSYDYDITMWVHKCNFKHCFWGLKCIDGTKGSLYHGFWSSLKWLHLCDFWSLGLSSFQYRKSVVVV